MSISTRIQAIEQHLTDDYSVLTLAGADLTNVDKNILNLKSTWQERLLYFINNGTDVVWNNWDKVTGEGTSISLNNTLEAKMKIELKGNTYQDSTTGKNLYNKYGDFNYPTTAWGDATFLLSNGTIKTVANFSASASRGIRLSLEQNTNYTVSGKLISSTGNVANDIAVVRAMGYSSSWSAITNYHIASVGDFNFTFNSGNNNDWFISLNSNGTTGAGISYEAIYDNIQVEKGTKTTYEPYTNGASPNPDYPQDIHVVSGDNSIEVCGKNLFDKNNVDWIKAYLTSSGTMYTSGNGKYCLGTNKYIKVLPNTTYYLSCSYGSNVDHLSNVFICEYDKDKNNIIRKSHVDNHSFTTESNTQYIRISWYLFYDENNNMIETNISTPDLYVTNIQLELSNQATTYEAYKGASYPITLPEGMFLGWIPNTDYRDKIDKSSGKNLFDKNNINGLNAYLDTTNNKLVSNNNNKSIYISCKPNTTYTISKAPSKRFGVAYTYTTPENNTAIYGTITNYDGASITITTDTNAQYLVVWLINSNISGEISYQTAIDTLQIEYGNQATPYEPYGTGWYLNKQIGKYTFTGNETLEEYSGAGAKKITNMIVAHTFESNVTPLGYSNISAMKPRAAIYTLSAEGLSYSNNEIYLYFANKTIQEILNILKDTDLYYLLATPTYTEITDSTLLSQLETLEKAISYDEQTNISQTNNDLPFIINATALKEMA